ncbi:MAG: Trk family potassium uptake protein [Clostridia bacterium]|nr:Trk family potassium uptake protein [Clostridia bacterium]
MAPKERNRRKPNLYRLLAVGFALIILTGAILLTLPVSSAEGISTPFEDALLTATSATCITGLIVYDTATHWSLFGQAVILCMIQVGGLGFMTLGSALVLLLKRNGTVSDRKQIAEALNTSDYQTATQTMKHVLAGTAAFEGAGAIILSARFIPDFGFAGGVWRGVFTSISAFCNAGFDLFGTIQPFSSVTAYSDDLVVNLTLSGLIILGGLGFLVWEDLYTNHSWKKLSLFSKTVLIVSGSLILLGTVLIFTLEYTNPETLGELSLRNKLLASFFQSVAPRTAGFNSIDLAATTESTQVLIIILMFIGASSGSTGGGVKVTTVAVLGAAMKSVLRGEKDATLFKKRISADTVNRALTLLFFPLILVLAGSVAINVAEPDVSFMEAMFECTSAFATVGLSMSVTPTLSLFSKIIDILLMYLGRVGMLTVSYALLTDRRKRRNTLRYPEGDILIG